MEHLNRFRKSLKYILILSFVGYLCWLIWLTFGFYLVKSNYKQSYHNLEVKMPVDILRDEHAIPLINAQNESDAMFALGFVHAQDRYWQMMMLREAGKGRLASHFGSDLLNHDRFVKTLDLDGLAKKTYANQSNQTKVYLKSYADGINAWQAQHAKDVLPLTPENFIFQIDFEPWQPQDAILILKLMHYDLTNKGLQSLKMMWLMQHLSDQQLKTVFPDLQYPNNQPWPKIDYISQSTLDNQSGASNAFAMNQQATLSGKSLLASDPHLRWTAPSMWMLVSMKWGDEYVSGGTIPGIPAILIGRNQDLAWGVTMTGSDDQDINLIKINKDNQYQGPKGYETLKTRQIDIDIKNGTHHTETVLSNPQGVVIDPGLYGFKIDPQNDEHFILQWTGFNTNDRNFEFQWALMRANSVNEINSDLTQMLVGPNTNLILADSRNVKMLMTGKLPSRSSKHPTQGRYPGDYANNETHWRGFFNQSHNPKIALKQGVAANTNNRITTSKFPNNVTFNWIDYSRIRRIDELISTIGVFDLEKIKEAQLDITSYKAKWLNSLLLYHLDMNLVEDRYKSLIASMQVWQGNMNKHGFEPLFYHVWLSLFVNKIYEANIGKHGKDIESLNPNFIENLLKDPKVQKHWCQNNCNDEVNSAYLEAINKMVLLFDDDYRGWQWIRLHYALHQHPTLGNIPFISLIANIEHPISGDEDTLAMARTLDDNGDFYQARKGAGLRVIVDFSASKDVINMINSTGQSGHLLSRFYRDQNKLWRDGKYIEYNPNKVKVKYTTKLLAN
ncbi:MAG: penicillin acylase family protein [Pseudomonadota bacterium]|nr:penicillin acylase family protein [Pseudomonadota bacterium]